MKKSLSISALSICIVSLIVLSSTVDASERSTAKHFENIKSNPVLLRQFLYAFPKGGDLHNHIDVGRMLANEAMSSIGIDKSEVHIGSYGEPVWPNGVVGSLSHDNGLVCCLVAR